VEREQEIARLVNVLHRIARASAFSSWVKREADAVKFCAAQYNRVLARLKELEPAMATLFGELAEDASPQVTRMAAHDLAAYFEDEIPARRERHWRAGHCRPRALAFALHTHGRRC
jgi:hypothetical protein